MSKTYKMQVELEEELHDILLKQQKERKDQYLPFLNLPTLAKLLMIEGMIQRRLALGKGSNHDQL